VRVLKAIGVILVLLVTPAVLVKVYLVHPTAEDILARMAAAYQAARWYSDTTTIGSPILSEPASYEIAYERPYKLRVCFHGILENQTIICDGLSLYRYLPGPNQYTISPAPDRVGPLLPEGQPMLTLALLSGELDLRGRARYVRRAEVDGLKVYVVWLKRPGAGSKAGGPKLSELVLYVGADDYLARKLETRLPVGDEIVAHALTHHRVSTRPVPPEMFRFVPPEGARMVARFERQQVKPSGAWPMFAPGMEGPAE